MLTPARTAAHRHPQRRAGSPLGISMTSSDANLAVQNVDLPILPSAPNRIVVNGTAARDAVATPTLDRSKSFVDFPAIGASNPIGSHRAP